MPDVVWPAAAKRQPRRARGAATAVPQGRHFQYIFLNDIFLNDILNDIFLNDIIFNDIFLNVKMGRNVRQGRRAARRHAKCSCSFSGLTKQPLLGIMST